MEAHPIGFKEVMEPIQPNNVSLPVGVVGIHEALSETRLRDHGLFYFLVPIP